MADDDIPKRVTIDPARVIFVEDYADDPEGLKQRMFMESMLYGSVYMVTNRPKGNK